MCAVTAAQRHSEWQGPESGLSCFAVSSFSVSHWLLLLLSLLAHLMQELKESKLTESLRVSPENQVPSSSARREELHRWDKRGHGLDKHPVCIVLHSFKRALTSSLIQSSTIIPWGRLQKSYFPSEKTQAFLAERPSKSSQLPSISVPASPKRCWPWGFRCLWSSRAHMCPGEQVVWLGTRLRQTHPPK